MFELVFGINTMYPKTWQELQAVQDKTILHSRGGESCHHT